MLEDLYIGADATGDKLFDNILRHPLPLKVLGFGYYSKVHAEQVRSLLVGPKKLSSLKKLTMDSIYGRQGLTFEDVGGAPPFMPGGGPAIPEKWVLGERHDAFSIEAVFELVRVAEEVGVELEGTLLDALRVEEALGQYLVRVEKWLERRTWRMDRSGLEEVLSDLGCEGFRRFWKGGTELTRSFAGR